MIKFQRQGFDSPLLHQFMFYDSAVYPKLKILEAAFPEIRKEMEAVSHGIKMRTWPEAEKFNGSWKVFGIYHCGRKLESCAKLCPETTKVIESMGEVYMAAFSRMGPKTRILHHFDDVPDGISRIHLGLSVPEGMRCGFSVEEEDIRWKEGKAFSFDPKKKHRAWNMTDYDRVILLLDFKNSKDFS